MTALFGSLCLREGLFLIDFPTFYLFYLLPDYSHPYFSAIKAIYNTFM